MKAAGRFLVVSFLMASAGCATIVHGRHQHIEVTSDPAGASATLECDGTVMANATTPAKLSVRRGADHCRIRVGAAGYVPQSIVLNRRIAASFWGNFGYGFVLGAAAGTNSANNEFNCDNPDGCGNDSNGTSLVWLAAGTAVPMLIDRSTGAIWQYDPSRVHVTLVPVNH